MGHMGNGYRGYGPDGQWGTWHNRVQGVWTTWAMQTYGAIGYRDMRHMGNGYRGYGPHGQWGTGVWGTLGHMYLLTPSQS